MTIPVGLSLTLFANASAASNAMRSFLDPVIVTLCVIASLACTFFLVTGGIQYMTSKGNPDNLEHAKRTLKNALIGLVLVIAAATLTAILSHAYGSSAGTMADKFPTLTPIQQSSSTSFWDVVTKAIIHVLENIVNSIGEPFVKALSYFTNSTPLMGDNSNVFNLWLALVGIADALFALVIALLGFHVMSFSSFGFDELDIKQILPQLALVFLLMNTSIFAIDAVIGLSNGMIHALQSGFPCTSIWDTLSDITKKSSGLGLGGLLVMIAFLILTVMLLVYYVGRLITLYIGAVLSPIILLLYLIPAFKDFAINALKMYLMVIFVLFVQVVIMQLASSIFSGMLQGDNSGQPNTLMALIVGLATVLALLKTQGVMQELTHAASTPRAAREVTGSFMRGVSYMNSLRSESRKNATRSTSKKKSSGKSSGNGSNGQDDNKTKRRAPTPYADSGLQTGQTRRAKKPPRREEDYTPVEQSEPKPRKRTVKREIET
ncbi:MAG TPA: type IV secretion system protein [Candidatus Saccharimonadales bacterium]|nr:type IV secretion system protein [Candidatus Saccharimonadales bacterium]